MLTLLIVDDEPLITDSLYDLFIGGAGMELNVMKAYSGREALDLMAAARVDILLTDISMPDVNGMDVHRRALGLWPDCIAIYLTSFDEFTFAQQALRNRSEDYILKTEGDEAVLAAVMRAAERVEGLRRDRLALERARSDMTLAMPLIQSKFIMGIVEGEGAPPEELCAQLRGLAIPLDGERPVLLLLGRVDRWPEGERASGRLKLAGRLRSAMEAHVPGNAAAFCTICESDLLVELVQPLPPEAGREGDDGEAFAALALRVRGTLDELQARSLESCGVTVSFAAVTRPVDWGAVGRAVGALRRRLCGGANIGGALLFCDPCAPPEEDAGKSANRIAAFVDEYARGNIGGDLSLTRFATLLNFHPFYLSRLFKHIAGKSLSEYVSEVRMEKARAMLRGRARVADIASALGFKTPSYFTCFFRKYEGMSPVEYRNRYGEV